ncbi:hypothetical protein [Alkalihalobacillus sp. AL-G]|uniref:hypothetical protein n=1 Tax=Alkalihalobacillus sp. AL-G TaxID=2926399 RepID=UPI00272B63B0|nr:hypothetical protein [Alkalihalobacillus sp. AL-G]WLD94110.1 hypothetical protein MOJ78_04220 [Alkalihalobacillus sp. AL-G]
MKEYFYNLCVQHMEKPVVVKTHDYKVYVGVIKNVDSENVYLQPFQEREGRFFPVLGAGLLGLGLGTLAGVTLFRPYPYYPYGYGYGYGW